MKKKILAITLCVCMCFSMGTIQAHAVDPFTVGITGEIGAYIISWLLGAGAVAEGERQTYDVGINNTDIKQAFTTSFMGANNPALAWWAGLSEINIKQGLNDAYEFIIGGDWIDAYNDYLEQQHPLITPVLKEEDYYTETDVNFNTRDATAIANNKGVWAYRNYSTNEESMPAYEIKNIRKTADSILQGQYHVQSTYTYINANGNYVNGTAYNGYGAVQQNAMKWQYIDTKGEEGHVRTYQYKVIPWNTDTSQNPISTQGVTIYLRPIPIEFDFDMNAPITMAIEEAKIMGADTSNGIKVIVPSVSTGIKSVLDQAIQAQEAIDNEEETAEDEKETLIELVQRLIFEENAINEELENLQISLNENAGDNANIGTRILNAIIEGVQEIVGAIQGVVNAIPTIFGNFINEGIALFKNLGNGITGVWYYVVQWIGSIRAGTGQILAIWGTLPNAMTLPIYASAVVILTFAIFKFFIL